MSRPLVQRWLAALALVAGCLSPALIGCPGTLDDPSRFQQNITCDPATMTCSSTTSTVPVPMVVTTAQLQAQLLVPKCVSCHSASSPLGDLDLTGAPAVLEGRLVEAQSGTAICNDANFVVPGRPELSLMYIKMTATPTCGAPMPFGSPVNAADAALMYKWIVDLGTP